MTNSMQQNEVENVAAKDISAGACNTYKIADVYAKGVDYRKNDSISAHDKCLLDLLRTVGFFSWPFADSSAITISTYYRTGKHRSITVYADVRVNDTDSGTTHKKLFRINGADKGQYTYTDFINGDDSVEQPASWSKVIRLRLRQININDKLTQAAELLKQYCVNV